MLEQALYSTAVESTASVAFLHIPLQIIARACSAASGRSKSLLGRASKALSARNRCSSRNLGIRQHSKTPPLRYFSYIPLDINARACSAATGRRKHGSGVLRRHLAPEIAVRASFMVFHRACVFLRTLFRNRCAWNCALLQAVLRAIAQAS